MALGIVATSYAFAYVLTASRLLNSLRDKATYKREGVMTFCHWYKSGFSHSFEMYDGSMAVVIC